MSKYLHGIHDPGGEHLMSDKPGWIVHTVSLKDQPSIDFRPWSDKGFTNIVRLNWHYEPEGTIPHQIRWDDFIKRILWFVERSRGANIFVLGNEPNRREEWPNYDKIEPQEYADLFNKVYATVKQYYPQAQLLVAGPAPWNNQADMDWIAYFQAICNALVDCDGFALHAYTHGTSPQLIWSTEQRNGWYWHFPVLYQQIQAIPPKFAAKPIHVTEIDQDDPWANENSGWVKEAFKSADQHNDTPGTQKIMSMSLYRWPKYDRWGIVDKPGVQQDFRDVVNIGYLSPAANQPPDSHTNVLPVIKNESKPVTTPTNLPPRNIDPRLTAPPREFGIVTPDLTNAEKLWYVHEAKWFNEQEAGGRYHIYGNVYDERGTKLYGIKLKVTWPDGGEAEVETKPDPVSPYGYNFPMGKSLKEFNIEVLGGSTPSEKATGIGRGHNGNPNIHTFTEVNFRLATVPKQSAPPVVTPPVTPPPVVTNPAPTLTHGLVLPVQGVITQHWGENVADYMRWYKQPGHNGTDFGAKQGTDVVSVADGKVMFVGFDPGSDPDIGGYGFYVRIWHPQLRLHSFYAHLQDRSTVVNVGQQVKKGQRIAKVGSTGNSSGPHLHLEFRLGSEYAYVQGTYGFASGRVDPEPILYIFGAKN